MKPRLLDLFCGAGLAADGYIAAGYEVTGVDIVEQSDYPGRFVRADATAVLALLGTGLLAEFDLVHASPPCQAFTRDATHAAEVMGVARALPWASLKEGFPPAYAEFIGRQITG